MDGMGMGWKEKRGKRTCRSCCALDRSGKRDEPNWTGPRAISFPIQVVYGPGSSLGTWTWAARRRSTLGKEAKVFHLLNLI